MTTEQAIRQADLVAFYLHDDRETESPACRGKGPVALLPLDDHEEETETPGPYGPGETATVYAHAAREAESHDYGYHTDSSTGECQYCAARHFDEERVS